MNGVFAVLWERWGAFDADLMASLVSAQCVAGGSGRLQFFFRFHSPGSAGPGQYHAFPPPQMVEAVLDHLTSQRAAMSVVVVGRLWPKNWLSRHRSRVRDSVLLGAGSVRDHDGMAVGRSFGAWLLSFG